MAQNKRKGFAFTGEKVNRYSLKKLTVGVVSIAVGSFIFGHASDVHAEQSENQTVSSTVNEATLEEKNSKVITLSEPKENGEPVAENKENQTEAKENLSSSSTVEHVNANRRVRRDVAAAHNIYLSDDTLGDTAGDGTKENPYRSVDYALQRINDGDTLHLLNSITLTRGKDFTINKNITVDGHGHNVVISGKDLMVRANTLLKDMNFSFRKDGSNGGNIVANNFNLTLDNVTTVGDVSANTPTLVAGSLSNDLGLKGSNGSIVIQNATNTKFERIIAGNKENEAKATTTTLTLGAGTTAENGVILQGAGAIQVTSESDKITSYLAPNPNQNTTVKLANSVTNVTLSNIHDLSLAENVEASLTGAFTGVSGTLTTMSGSQLNAGASAQTVTINNIVGPGEVIVPVSENALVVTGNVTGNPSVNLNTANYSGNLVDLYGKTIVKLAHPDTINVTSDLQKSEDGLNYRFVNERKIAVEVYLVPDANAEITDEAIDDGTVELLANDRIIYIDADTNHYLPQVMKLPDVGNKIILANPQTETTEQGNITKILFKVVNPGKIIIDGDEANAITFTVTSDGATQTVKYRLTAPNSGYYTRKGETTPLSASDYEEKTLDGAARFTNIELEFHQGVDKRELITAKNRLASLANEAVDTSDKTPMSRKAYEDAKAAAQKEVAALQAQIDDQTITNQQVIDDAVEAAGNLINTLNVAKKNLVPITNKDILRREVENLDRRGDKTDKSPDSIQAYETALSAYAHQLTQLKESVMHVLNDDNVTEEQVTAKEQEVTQAQAKLAEIIALLKPAQSKDYTPESVGPVYIKQAASLEDVMILSQVTQSDLPKDTQLSVKNKPTTTNLGEYIAQVEVVYPDHSTDTVEVKVVVYTAVLPTENPVQDEKLEVTEKEQITEIGYNTQRIADETLEKGVEVVKVAGKNGKQVDVYRIIKLKDEIVARELLSTSTENPIDAVIHYGTKEKPESKPIPDPTPQPKPTPEPTPQPEGKPQPKPTPEPTPQPEDKPKPKPTPDPTPQPEGKPKPKPIPDPTPQPEGKPQPKPTPDPTPQPEEKPQPQPIPESKVKPEVEPNVEVDVKPEEKLTSKIEQNHVDKKETNLNNVSETTENHQMTQKTSLPNTGEESAVWMTALASLFGVLGVAVLRRENQDNK